VIKVHVLLFAAHARAAGVRELAWELTEPCSAQEIAEAVATRFELSLGGTMLAINDRYAVPTQPLADGDRLALIPPVSGG
jgi:molybdopterin converting factor small subunit